MSNEVLERMLDTCLYFQENENAARLLIVDVIPEQEKVIVYREDISFQYEMSYDYINSFTNTAVWWKLAKVDPSEYNTDMDNISITSDLTGINDWEYDSYDITSSTLDVHATDHPSEYDGYGIDIQTLDLSMWSGGNMND